MELQGLQVAFERYDDNFISLPPSLTNVLYSTNTSPQDVVVELRWRHKKTKIVYAGWNGMNSSIDNSIQIGTVFAKAIELSKTDRVDIKIIHDPPEATTVEVEPLTPSDWEVIELHAGSLESELIYQTRAVALNQTLILYTSGVTATLKVLKISPQPSNDTKYAKITANAEIHVAPKTRRSLNKKSQSVRSVSSSRRTSENTPFILSRGIALPHPLFRKTEYSQFEVYANLDKLIYSLEKAQYVNVSVIPGPQDAKAKTPDDTNKTTPKICAKLVHDPTCDRVIGLSRILSIALGIEGTVGNIIKLEKAVKLTTIKSPRFVLHPFISDSKPSNNDDGLSLKNNASRSTEESQKKEVKNQITKAFVDLKLDSTVLTNLTKFPPIPGLPEGALLEIKDCLDPLYPFEKGKYTIELGNEILVPRSRLPSTLQVFDVIKLEEPIGQEELVKQLTFRLLRGNKGALVHGASGSGKTLIVEQLAQELQNKGHYVLKAKCIDISRESLINARETIDFWINSCSWFSPSLLVLEGIEDLFSAESEQVDSSQSRQLTEYFVQSLSKIFQSRSVSVLATARSKDAAHEFLFSSHCIADIHPIRPPNKDIRQKIIEKSLKKFDFKFAKDFDKTLLSLETEGYLPNDLKILIDRIHHEAVYESIENHKDVHTISTKIFSKAIKNFVPSSLRGVKLQKSTTTWHDIGGLTEAKTILLETLEWPTKYEPIFKAATLRLRSGILLYGYPGCGKTLLASAVAGQCGLNFISVKGPEILNKYIGASEQSIRDLFDRAQAAKPCILFFDEFDSIAPKRGHDSTGVTDRVVNQMLTQMDGAEGLDGVYVLAATSRPDLIDSALLRPGRLDKSVICDMPQYKDRLSILRAITRKMSLGKDVSLEQVAKESEGFSGADLQALSYQAYLGAVHEKLENEKLENEGLSKISHKSTHEFFQLSLNQLKQNNGIKPHLRTEILNEIEALFKNEEASYTAHDADQTQKKGSSIRIRHKDFVSALRDTKSSVSASERNKLSAIYSKFVSERDGNLPNGTPDNAIGARSTLM